MRISHTRNMAAKMKRLNYSTALIGKDALSWSKDNRIAFCTEAGVLVLSFPYIIEAGDSEMMLNQTSIPLKPVLDISNFTNQELYALKRQLKEEELCEDLIMDKVMNPNNPTDNIQTGYVSAVWSPRGGDYFNRSLLSVLSRDFRLCLYRQPSLHKKYEEVCDLSLMYLESTSWEIENIDKVKQFHKYKDWCHGRAVIAFSWYPVLLTDAEDGSQYALLAAGMLSSDVILWKVAMPCTSSDDVSVIACVCSHASVISTMRWSETKANLYISYTDGQIHRLCVDTGQERIPTPEMSAVFTDTDGIQVSIMYLTTLDKVDVLLVPKAQCLMAFHLDEKVSRTNIFTDNTLPLTAFTQLDNGEILMGSLDGLVQKLKIDWSSDSGIQMSVEKLPVNIDEGKRQSVYGLSLSPYSMYIGLATRTTSFFDYWDLPSPTCLSILPLHHVFPDLEKTWTEYVTAALLEETEEQANQEDVLEVFRQGLSTSQQIADIFPDNQSSRQLSVKNLRLKRYSLRYLIQTVKRKLQLEDEMDKDKLTKLEREFELVTMLIFSRYVEACLEKITSLKIRLAKKDKQILGQMVQVLQSPPDDSKQEAVDSICDRVTKKLGTCKPEKQICCICSASIALENFQSICSNGHKMGVCCKTLLVFEDFDYRSCLTCKTTYKTVNSLADFTWLAWDPNCCTFCGRFLY